VVLGGRDRNATGSPDPETAMPTPVGIPIVNGLKPGLRVVVTAGASGIGRAIVDMLTVHGARIHVCDVADAALDVVDDFLGRGRTRALSDEVMRSLTPAQQVIKKTCRRRGFHFCGYNEQQYLNEDIALLFASRLR